MIQRPVERKGKNETLLHGGRSGPSELRKLQAIGRPFLAVRMAKAEIPSVVESTFQTVPVVYFAITCLLKTSKCLLRV